MPVRDMQWKFINPVVISIAVALLGISVITSILVPFDLIPKNKLLNLLSVYDDYTNVLKALFYPTSFPGWRDELAPMLLTFAVFLVLTVGYILSAQPYYLWLRFLGSTIGLFAIVVWIVSSWWYLVFVD